jgi:hypothetical protein
VRPRAWGAVGTLLLAACSSGGSESGSFTIEFPSVEAAIDSLTMTAGVQVSVYPTSVFGTSDASAAGACQMLVEESLNSALNQTALAQTQPISACDLAAGQGSLPIPFGNYAFLAVAAPTSGPPYLIGCAEQTISTSNSRVVIPMTLAAPSPSQSTTSCTTLAQACPSGNGC